MGIDPIRFPYSSDGTHGEGALPYIPIQLQYDAISLHTIGLVDSGASVNVIPHSVGLRLGAIWENQGQEVVLGGNLASAPAKGILLNAMVGSFAPVRLVFAWSQLDNIPIILGQLNFFQAFDISFCGAKQTFDIAPYG